MEKLANIVMWTVVLILIVAIWLCITVSKSHASMTEGDIIRCTLGEARSQSKKEMQAVAEVIRRRDSERGIYGCKVDFKHEIPYMRARGILSDAREAVRASKWSNITRGATHFEGVKFKVPYWAKSMEKLAHIGDTVFYGGGE